MDTPLKTNMDTQNDGLEKETPFKQWQLWVSMLVFGGVPKNNGLWENVSFFPSKKEPWKLMESGSDDSSPNLGSKNGPF